MSTDQIVELVPLRSVHEAKIIGSINKVYDKQIKSYYYGITTSSVSRFQIPKNDQSGLNLCYSTIVLQIWIPRGRIFSFEVMTTDNNKVFYL